MRVNTKPLKPIVNNTNHPKKNQGKEDQNHYAGNKTKKHAASPAHKTLLHYNNKPNKKSLASTCLSKTRIPSSSETRYALLGKTFCVNSSLNDFNSNLHKTSNPGDMSNVQNSGLELENNRKGNRDIITCGKLNSFDLKYNPNKLPTKQKIDLSSFNNNEDTLNKNNINNTMRININEQYAHLKTIIKTNSPNGNSMNNNRDFDWNMSSNRFHNVLNKSIDNKIKLETDNIKSDNNDKNKKKEMNKQSETKKEKNKLKVSKDQTDIKNPVTAFKENCEIKGGFLKRICNVIDSKIKELSFNALTSQSKKTLPDPIKVQSKKKWREEFSQTYTLYFPQYPKRLMSNITQKHFNNKMNFYKQLCHNPFNPYSPNYASEIIHSKNKKQDDNSKNSSQDLPVIHNKKLVSDIM